MSPKGGWASFPVLLGRPGLQAIVGSPVVFRRVNSISWPLNIWSFLRDPQPASRHLRWFCLTKGTLKVIKIKNRMAACTSGQFIEVGPLSGLTQEWLPTEEEKRISDSMLWDVNGGKPGQLQLRAGICREWSCGWIRQYVQSSLASVLKRNQPSLRWLWAAIPTQGSEPPQPIRERATTFYKMHLT